MKSLKDKMMTHHNFPFLVASTTMHEVEIINVSGRHSNSKLLQRSKVLQLGEKEENCQKSVREVEKMMKSGNAFMSHNRWLFINSLVGKLKNNAEILFVFFSFPLSLLLLNNSIVQLNNNSNSRSFFP